MTAIVTQLNPPIWFQTPKGGAYAHFLIYEGMENQLRYVTFLDSDGSCWVFEHIDVKLGWNRTMGRVADQNKRWDIKQEGV